MSIIKVERIILIVKVEKKSKIIRVEIIVERRLIMNRV